MNLNTPFYRLFKNNNKFDIDVVYSIDEQGNVNCKTIASVLTKESAMALLKLAGANEYHDWTDSKTNWNTPLIKLEL